MPDFRECAGGPKWHRLLAPLKSRFRVSSSSSFSSSIWIGFSRTTIRQAISGRSFRPVRCNLSKLVGV